MPLMHSAWEKTRGRCRCSIRSGDLAGERWQKTFAEFRVPGISSVRREKAGHNTSLLATTPCPQDWNSHPIFRCLRLLLDFSERGRLGLRRNDVRSSLERTRNSPSGPMFRLRFCKSENFMSDVPSPPQKELQNPATFAFGACLHLSECKRQKPEQTKP